MGHYWYAVMTKSLPVNPTLTMAQAVAPSSVTPARNRQVGAARDQLLRRGLDHADFMRPQRVEAQGSCWGNLILPSEKHVQGSLRIYNNRVRVTYDLSKRARALADRGLDFEDAALVFEGVTVEVEDTRKDYGERRIICYGMLEGRIVVVGYTPRGTVRHVFSMRKANDREQTRLAPYLEV